MQLVVVLSIWLHLLATVIWMGQAILGSLVYMPILSQQLKGPALGAAMGEMARKIRPFIWGSIVVFIITGIPMTTGKMALLGLTGFGNPWSILILVKHIIVVVMILLAAYMDRVALPGLVEVLTAAAGPPGGAQAGPPPKASGPPPHVQAAIRRSRLGGSAVMVCGIVVLLLTAIAEAL